MKHRITAAIAAAAIALGSAAPVRAEEGDFLKLAIGAVGVGLLVHELDKKNKEEIRSEEIRRRGEIENVSDDEHLHNWLPGDDWRRDRKFFEHKHRGKIIPRQCIFEGKIRGRWRDVVSERCMEKMGASRRLPRECRVEVRARGDRRQAYGLRCLEHHGYRVARGRY